TYGCADILDGESTRNVRFEGPRPADRALQGEIGGTADRETRSLQGKLWRIEFQQYPLRGHTAAPTCSKGINSKRSFRGSASCGPCVAGGDRRYRGPRDAVPPGEIMAYRVSTIPAARTDGCADILEEIFT